MCGIYFYIHFLQTKGIIPSKTFANLSQLKHRGPDETLIRHFDSSRNPVSITTAFHRLAVMDIRHAAMQPFEYNGLFCLINGEIWNHAELSKELSLNTNCDCEVILPLFEKLCGNVSDLCRKLDGEYSFVIYDSKNDLIHIGTDQLSVRPLFYSLSPDGFGFASESKALSGEIHRVKPGSCARWNIYEMRADKMLFNQQFMKYNSLYSPIEFTRTYEKVRDTIGNLLTKSIRKKSHPDRSFGCLLSGGLDSSLVAALLARIKSETIHTFTVGIVDQTTNEELPEDIIAARKVAKHIGSIHHEAIYTMKEAFERIPNVIKLIESWDQTTIRASTPMYLVLEYISKNYPEIAVVYSGEVADELFAGYLYTHRSPSPQETREDAIRLLNEIHTFDGLRADRIVAGWGKELRLPFFDRDLLEWVLSSPPEYFDPKTYNAEKYILRDAFSTAGILPEEILWRTKEALSDASSHKSGWKSYIQKQLTMNEDVWYRQLFDENCGQERADLIPHKWMPCWSPEAGNDSSATALNIHK
jgi:asparagine synthase (glutamine-hydrolysing)